MKQSLGGVFPSQIWVRSKFYSKMVEDSHFDSDGLKKQRVVQPPPSSKRNVTCYLFFWFRFYSISVLGWSTGVCFQW